MCSGPVDATRTTTTRRLGTRLARVARCDVDPVHLARRPSRSRSGRRRAGARSISSSARRVPSPCRRRELDARRAMPSSASSQQGLPVQEHRSATRSPPRTARLSVASLPFPALPGRSDCTRACGKRKTYAPQEQPVGATRENAVDQLVWKSGRSASRSPAGRARRGRRGAFPASSTPSARCAERSASLTAASTRSASISGSSGSIAFGSIVIPTISPPPVAFTVTMPPPAEASTISLRGLLLRLLHLRLHLLRLLHQLVHVQPVHRSPPLPGRRTCPCSIEIRPPR